MIDMSVPRHMVPNLPGCFGERFPIERINQGEIEHNESLLSALKSRLKMDLPGLERAYVGFGMTLQ